MTVGRRTPFDAPPFFSLKSVFTNFEFGFSGCMDKRIGVYKP
jgi:hypothetical protein